MKKKINPQILKKKIKKLKLKRDNRKEYYIKIFY